MPARVVIVRNNTDRSGIVMLLKRVHREGEAVKGICLETNFLSKY